MRTLPILTIVFFALNVKGQKLENFELVDEFKLNKVPTKVFFKDPLKQMIKEYPDFDNKKNEEKYELLDAYLHSNVLYIFQTINKQGLSKSYLLTGNPKKVRTKYYFKIDIVNTDVFELSKLNDSTIEKTIDKINIGGAFFENMFIFQTAEGKKVIGQGINIWGYITMIEPYSNVKSTVSDIIKKDMNNEIPDEILAKPEVEISPLFDYQTCGLETIKERELITTVYQYDSLGKVKNKYPRTEKDYDLYHASISSDDIGGVTSFPFFSSTDTIKESGNRNIFYVHSSQKFLSYYLKDIKVYKNDSSGNVERIEGTLLIHGYSAKGESINYELYLAEFAKIGKCFLPKTIKFYPIDDIECKRPRIVTDINYKLK
ncbi:MAG TPA: hypothetical protein VE978_06900 [Chitinophagales bacterium]|nr:hypothetical protein [Chitinophagales bacterium]